MPPAQRGSRAAHEPEVEGLPAQFLDFARTFAAQFQNLELRLSLQSTELAAAKEKLVRLDAVEEERTRLADENTQLADENTQMALELECQRTQDKAMETWVSQESAALAAARERLANLDALEAEVSKLREKLRDAEQQRERAEIAEARAEELTIALADTRGEEVRLYLHINELESRLYSKELEIRRYSKELESAASSSVTERLALEDGDRAASGKEKQAATAKAEHALVPMQGRTNAQAAGELQRQPTSVSIRKCPPLPNTPWLPTYKHRPTAKVRLFLFYGAGLSVKLPSLQNLQKIVEKSNPEIELNMFEYPGHLGHTGADLITNMSEFEKMFFQDLTSAGHSEGLNDFFNTAPFAMLGESTGARVAISIAQALWNRHCIKPMKLYIVGRSPPLVDGYSYQPESFSADSQQFWKRVSALDEMYLERYQADGELNRTPLKPLPRKWLVGQPKVLLKRTDDGKIWKQNWGPGAVVQVTGKEKLDNLGRWVQIDTDHHTDHSPGWWLANQGLVQVKLTGDDSTFSVTEPMLEEAEDHLDPIDDSSLFRKVPIPLQVHFSTADNVAPYFDLAGSQRPMAEWSRLTSDCTELVVHEGLLHDELLKDRGMLEHICRDLLKTLG